MRSAFILSVVLLATLPAVSGVTVAAAAGSRDAKKQHKEAQAHLKKGVDLKSQGQFEDALNEFLSVDALEPSPAVTKHIAECHEALGHSGDALAAYRKYLQQAPSASDADAVKKHLTDMEFGQRVDSARSLVTQRKYNEAIAEFRNLQKVKNDPHLWYDIGNAQDLMGDVKGALESYERFLKEAPTASEAGDVRGRIAGLSGKKMAAAPASEQGGSSGPARKPWYTSKPGMALSIGGLLLAIGGGVTLGLAANANSAIDGSMNEPTFLDNLDTARTFGPIGLGLAGAGLVALTVGIVLIALHARPAVKEGPTPDRGRQYVPQSFVPSLSFGDLR